MPRKPHTNSPLHPYHLDARSNNREWFDLPMELVWDIMCRYLYFVRFAYEMRIHSFVLMNNHFHLIASFPKGNMSEATKYFMRETSRRIGEAAGRINHTYGSNIHPTMIKSAIQFANAYKYVYRNPVTAKIVEHVEDYPYSTLHGLLGQAPIAIPIEEDTILFDSDPAEVLRWLNTPATEKNMDAIRKALKHGEFKLAKDAGGKAHPLEKSLL